MSLLTTAPVLRPSSGAAGAHLQDTVVPSGVERSTACGGTLVRVLGSSRRALVTVHGELDLSGAILLTAVLRHVQERGAQGVDVDLTEVSFADTHGLAPVLDGPATIVATSPAVRLVLNALESAAPVGRGVPCRGAPR